MLTVCLTTYTTEIVTFDNSLKPFPFRPASDINPVIRSEKFGCKDFAFHYLTLSKSSELN